MTIKKSDGLKFEFGDDPLPPLDNMTEEGHYTHTNKHGGQRTPGPGKKLGPPKKPPAEKYRRRLITLPPETDDRLIQWSIDTDNDISALINRLVVEYFERAEK